MFSCGSCWYQLLSDAGGACEGLSLSGGTVESNEVVRRSRGCVCTYVHVMLYILCVHEYVCMSCICCVCVYYIHCVYLCIYMYIYICYMHTFQYVLHVFNVQMCICGIYYMCMPMHAPVKCGSWYDAMVAQRRGKYPASVERLASPML